MALEPRECKLKFVQGEKAKKTPLSRGLFKFVVLESHYVVCLLALVAILDVERNALVFL